ncbi:MAG: Polyphenol oxidase [Steroidobacteraceae bacterium]|nr:Polyphenol oxidase [Steroidobacteraceae bacterium]
MWITPQWSAPATVHAAFTLRTGGTSAAPFDTLNLGAHVGDDPLRVAANRRRIADALALPSSPAWLRQVHGVAVREIGAAGAMGSVPHGPADAAFTRAPGAVCAILVADCLPVLLASRDGSVVGAAHAGWRGLAAGVLEATVKAMGVPARDLVAWLGPSISPRHFEVGEDVRSAFVASDAATAAAFRPGRADRWWCDLPALARHRLAASGLTEIALDGACTFAERDRFFSFRRDGPCGRMAALVWRSEA